MSNQDIKPRLAARPKASLIAAAAASASSSAQDVKPVIPTPIIPTARPAPAINSNTAGGVSMSASASTISEGSSRSTPVPVGSGTTGETVAKMKFRPKASAVKRVKQCVSVLARAHSFHIVALVMLILFASSCREVEVKAVSRLLLYSTFQLTRHFT